MSLTAMLDKYWKMSLKSDPPWRVGYFKDGFIKGRFQQHKYSSLIWLCPVCLIPLSAQFLGSHLLIFILKIAFTFDLFSLPLFLCAFISLSSSISPFPSAPSLSLPLSLYLLLSHSHNIMKNRVVYLFFLWYHLRHACNLPWLSPRWQEERDEL